MLDQVRAIWFSVLVPILTSIGGLTCSLLLINWLFGRRSQIDAWCLANPYTAGVLKIFRGFGHDPWQILQGVSLIVRKRLPDPIEGVVDVVIPPPPRFPEDFKSQVADAARKTGLLCLFLIGGALVLAAAFGCSTSQAYAETAAKCQKSIAPLNGEYAAAIVAVVPACSVYSRLRDCPDYQRVKADFEPRYERFAAECSS
jgi:hypothetical protein